MYFFWRLLLAHLLGDFTFQTNRIARWKRENISGVFFHVLIFLFFAVAINYQYLPSPRFALTLLILSATHVIEDQWRVISVTKYHSHDNIFLFLYDQFIHLLLIFVLAPTDPPFAVTEKWVYLLIILVVAAQFTTILIYYLKKLFLEKAAIVDQEKYHGIAERLVVVGAFLIPGKWYWLVLPLIILLVVIERFSLKKTQPNLDYSALNLVVSNIMAAACSITARTMWY